MIARSTKLKTAGLLALPVVLLGLFTAFRPEANIPTANAASVDMFLEIEGVPGEAERGIEISSYSWGMSNSGSMSTGSGGGSGKVSMQDFHFTKKFDRSSFSLMKSGASGVHFPKATLRLMQEDGGFLAITLSDVVVSSYGVEGEGGLPTEEFSLSYQKIEWSSVKDPDLRFSWDLKKGTK